MDAGGRWDLLRTKAIPRRPCEAEGKEGGRSRGLRGTGERIVKPRRRESEGRKQISDLPKNAFSSRRESLLSLSSHGLHSEPQLYSTW